MGIVGAVIFVVVFFCVCVFAGATAEEVTFIYKLLLTNKVYLKVLCIGANKSKMKGRDTAPNEGREEEEEQELSAIHT